MPDTNIYLHQDSYFDHIPWRELSGSSNPVRVLIPAAVLRELDKSKNGNGQNKVSDTCKETVRTRARVTSRRIRTRFASPLDVVELDEGVTLELLLDARQHRRLEREDDELIERADAIQSLAGREVHIVTVDGNMQFAAQVAGVGVLPLAD
ncbi:MULTISPECIES: PIN domain-containing protein [unclassified Nocardioides]|uniref:PIN domain-containing protein n=1 Tax=unclassified Nocardioides TaxID=2615069 RepID=UPI0009F083C4|nr:MULTISPECIES: PIN domain-containing protein [unclassified Nocardioides]GAW51492.1 uncharacterized protein PD653B2_3835 [Nocardioides sp. PD653-B2]GAW54074.1 uncharacterized protein PD653_1481 [Nocardioides sp. PD653]